MNHLMLSRDCHRGVEHVFVQERHADLEAVRHRGLVRAEAVVHVKVLDLAHALLVQLRAVGRLVEVQVRGRGRGRGGVRG